jgi:hypothetical protein
MNFGEAIFEMLSDDSAVAAKVAIRIYPETVPQNAPFPAIRWQIVSANPSDTKSGPADVDSIRVQFDSIAPTFKEVQEIDAAIRQAIDRVRGEFAGVEIDGVRYEMTTGSYDSHLNLFMRSSDYFFRVRR